MFGVDGGAGDNEYEVEMVKMLALGLVSPDPFCTLSSYYPPTRKCCTMYVE
jgi:hypothetical protein